MLRPITVAPILASESSTTGVLSLTSPPGRPCIARHTVRGKTHSCRRIPPIPSGLSTLWRGPATNPSSDIEILKRSLAKGYLALTVVGSARASFPPTIMVRALACLVDDSRGFDLDKKGGISKGGYADPGRRRLDLAREELPESTSHWTSFLGPVVDDVDPQ